jgi:dTDP-4-dehydrorhamnose reductase
MIGSEVMLRAASRGHDVIGTSRVDAWVPHRKLFKHKVVNSNEDHRYVIMHTEPHVVVHCAAMTDVDGCEMYPEKAWHANFDLTKTIASECKSEKVDLIHISTEAVFGTEASEAEDCPFIMPKSVYGITKAAAEAAVRTICHNHAILRIANVYSGRKWVRPNFARNVVESLQNDHEFYAWEDQTVMPTLASAAAERIVEVAERRLRGNLHIADDAMISRFHFAQRIAERFNLPLGKIIPTRMPEQRKSSIAHRAGFATLNVDLATSMLQYKPLALKDGIERFFREMQD